MLIEKAKNTISRFDLLKKDDRVLVAVSGGPDSVALLYVLNGLRKGLNLKLFIAHLNHMMRPGAADRDEAFAKRLGAKLGIPVISEAADVPQLAKRERRSLEDAARVARYDFFIRAAKEVGASKIALAHTQDDQAETVLIRLLRGSGLLGLSAISAKRSLGSVEIIRPFINVPKKDILHFLSRKKIAFCEDKTNIRSVYLRNKVRLKLLPFIARQFEPDIKRILADTAENLKIDYDYLSKIAEARFKKYTIVSSDEIRLKESFLKEDTAVVRMILREAIRRAKGDLEGISYGHLKELSRLIKKKKRWSMSLPGDIVVRKAPDKLIFSRKADPEGSGFRGEVIQLAIPGSTRIPGIKKEILADFVRPPADFKNKKSPNTEYFDPARLKFPLLVRFRQAQDKVRPIGMRGHKRLKRLFIDEKVPFEKRKSVPLIIAGGEIIWVCGLKRADIAKVDKASPRVLRLKLLHY